MDYAINVRFHIVPSTVSKPNKTINENVMDTNAQVSQRMAPRTQDNVASTTADETMVDLFSRVL
jgi:hypothetical protein